MTHCQGWTTAILVLGHGSRCQEANAKLTEVAGELQESLPGHKVRAAFMEFGTPSLSLAVARLMEEGAERIIVAPYFLFPGMHLQRDIPAAIDREREKYPRGDFILAPPLGTDSRLVAVLLDRVQEVL